MSYENVEWINQRYYHYTDKMYNTNASIELTMSCTTEDQSNFSAPTLNISITNQKRRVFSLDLERALTISNSIKMDITSNTILAYDQEKEYKKRHRDKDLIFKCVKGPNGEQLISMFIFFNESDYSKIVVPFDPVFRTFVYVLNLFTRDYTHIWSGLTQRYLQTKSYNQQVSIGKQLTILPSQLMNTPSIIPDQNIINNNITQEKKDVPFDGMEQMSEFEKFTEDTIEKVEIKEIETVITDIVNGNDKPKQTEIISPLIDDVLKGDISNYESLINSIYHDVSPLDKITEVFVKSTGKTKEELLPHLSDQDWKSALFVSKIFFKSFLTNYTENAIPIPSQVPNTIMYKIGDSDDIGTHNIEMAYDLTLINCYIKLLRGKLEEKIADSQNNKALLHVASRCFTDIFYFSFINTIEPSVIKSCVLSRFKYYSEKGFFKFYDTTLKQYQCNPINEHEMSTLLDVMGEKLIGKLQPISVNHRDMYDNNVLHIPSENPYSIEQITKTLTEIEIRLLLGKKLEDITQNPEIVNIFKLRIDSKKGPAGKPKSNGTRKPTVKYESSFHRFINEVDFKKQIPEKYKVDFEEYIKNMGLDEFDYNRFPMDEFGDDIIKAGYCWNAETPRIQKYSDFRTAMEDCLSKDLIIAKIKGTEAIIDPTEEDWLSDINLTI